MDKEAEIRQIAYELWEKAGRPSGRADSNYLEAESAWLEARQRDVSAGTLPRMPITKPSGSELQGAAFEGPPVRLESIMSRDVVSISPQDTISAAARKMSEGKVGALLVMEAGALKGIVTDRDIAVRCVGKSQNPRDAVVATCMSSPVVTAPASMEIVAAAELMTKKQIKRLPIVQTEKVIGIVSMSDIAAAMDRPMHHLLIGMGAARRVA